MRELIGKENVKKTYSGHAKYYLVEDDQNLKALSDYRKSKIVGQRRNLKRKVVGNHRKEKT